ncbi:hypothetical protein [Reichenbachiella sp.]|uniref:hypothetical protein n=1 Tax=Reichenbachiella sp. TaxID=2184521 RepID=UPI003BAF7AE0
MRLVLNFCLLLISIPLFGKQDDVIKEKADSLQFLAREISYGNAFEDVYLRTFPSDFDTFLQIFGDRNETSSGSFDGGPLYDEGYTHIMEIMLTIDEKVDLQMYYQKLVDASINGRWQADGVNFFSGLVGYKMKERPDRFFSILCQKNPEEIDSFWDFYVDGPHGEKRLDGMLLLVEDYPKLKSSVKRYIK